MFQLSSDDVSVFTEVVTCFISKLIDDIICVVTVKVFLNQKPSVAKTICKAVKACTAAYSEGLSSGDMSLYKVASNKQ